MRRVNVGGTKALAEEAVRSGVKRFIFLSSIQAIAKNTANNRSVNTNTSAIPQGAYGSSKLEAEQVLLRLSMQSQMEVVIIRPPLVYGPGVKANFRNLLQLTDIGIPLPLSTLDSNRRSFVSISNLIDLILLCLKHPAAANQTIHVSDDDDISTAELLRRIGRALGKPVRNLPITQSMLKSGLRLVGKGDWMDKLCGDLRVDISEAKRLLGWKPKVTMEEEFERTARWWRARKL
jgi:UDP-glucose 4-epimerase